jgi:selenocysteine lyase/cysteine desulfurase
MAAIGMEMMADWGSDAVVTRLATLTRRIAEGVAGLAITCPAESVRAPHILSLGFPEGMPEGLVERLASEQIYAAPRLGRLRISPHVYNDEVDCDRLIDALRRALA